MSKTTLDVLETLLAADGWGEHCLRETRDFWDDDWDYEEMEALHDELAAEMAEECRHSTAHQAFAGRGIVQSGDPLVKKFQDALALLRIELAQFAVDLGGEFNLPSHAASEHL